jgi:hypothetical protein
MPQARLIELPSSRTAMIVHIRSLAVSSLICVGTIASAAWAADRLETEYARSRAESVQHFDRNIHEQKAHYERTWVKYCAKDPSRGGCDTMLRRIKQAKPVAETLSELQNDPTVDVDSAKR